MLRGRLVANAHRQRQPAHRSALSDPALVFLVTGRERRSASHVAKAVDVGEAYIQGHRRQGRGRVMNMSQPSTIGEKAKRPATLPTIQRQRGTPWKKSKAMMYRTMRLLHTGPGPNPISCWGTLGCLQIPLHP